MSFYRFYRLAGRTRSAFQGQYRYSSAKSQKPRSLGVRLLTYGTLGTMATVGGTLGYASHDQDFKQAVDQYVPGFAASADVFHRGMKLAEYGWTTIKPIITPDRGNTGLQPPSPSSLQQLETKSGGEETSTKNNDANSSKSVNNSTAPEQLPTDERKEPGKGVESEKEEVVRSSEVKKEDVPIVSTPPKQTEEVNVSNPEPVTTVSTPEPVATPVTTPEPVSTPGPVTTPEPVSTSEPVSTLEPEPSQETPTVSDPGSEGDSALEAKKLSIQNALQSIYQEYIFTSDKVIDSLQKVAQSMKSHFNKIKESTDNETDISESVGAMKEKVDEAYKKVDECKASREEVSKRLSATIAEALHLGILEELVEQICDKALEYQKSFEAADSEVKETQDEHKSWLEGLPQSTKDEKKKGSLLTADDDQLKLGSLDTQQQALLMMLRKKIEKMEEEEDKRLADALTKQESVLKEEFARSLEEERQSFNDQLKSKEHELEALYEGKMKEQLYHQADAYAKHLAENLQAQANELRVQLEENFMEKFSEKKREYQSCLTAAMARLKGIHSMVTMVSEAGRSAEKQQNIRTASDTLTTAIVTSNSDPDPYSKHSISKEVNSLKEAAGNDEFISSVISSIPKQAVEEGITSESGLIKRFSRVRKICKRVALVGEEGGGLGMYLLSFLQSLLTFDMIYDKMLSPRDYDSSANTFRLLSMANSYLDKGDLETAVRLVNQLSGEAGRVAEDWVKEACLYLETRQAVMVVSEYLAASCYSVVQDK